MSKRATHLDWIFGGMIAAAGVGLVYALRCSPVIRRGDRIVLFGDSLSVGLDPFFASLCRDSGCSYESKVKGGTTMRFWRRNARATTEALVRGAQVVMISLGTNDALSNFTDAELAAEASELVNIAKAAGAKVLWILPPKLPKPDRATPQIRGVVQTAGETVFESSQLPIAMTSDNIHPRPRGTPHGQGPYGGSLLVRRSSSL